MDSFTEQYLIEKSQKLEAQRNIQALTREATALADPDEDEWILMSSGSHLIGGEVRKELTEQDYQSLRAAAERMYRRNPHARAIIRNLTKYTIGRGAQIIIEDTESPDTSQQAKEVWEQFEEKNKWTLISKELVQRTFRDGEYFLHFTDIDSGIPRINFLEPDWIKSKDSNITHGIETVDNDVGDIISYRLIISNTEKTLKPSEVQHGKINVDSNVKRGRTILEPVLKDLKEAQNLRDIRAVLNKVRTAIVMVHKVSGTSPQKRAIVENQASTSQTTSRGTNRQKAPKAGTKVTIDKESDIEFKAPNLGSGEAAEDMRMLLLAMAAGVGLPEFIVTSDASNANFASTLVAESPYVKEIEDWQDYFEFQFCDIFERVLNFARPQGLFPENEILTCSFEFPPIVSRDIDKETKAWNILFMNGVVSKTTMAAKFGLDFEKELEKMEMDRRSEFGDFTDEGMMERIKWAVQTLIESNPEMLKGVDV